MTPRNPCNSFTVVGRGWSLIAVTLLAIGDTPAAETWWPKKSTSGTPNTHFSRLMTSPAACSRRKRVRTCCKCSLMEVHEDEVKASQDAVHQPLECVSSIPEAESHPKEFEESKRSGDGGLRNITRMHKDLMISLAQVHLAEDGAACYPLLEVI